MDLLNKIDELIYDFNEEQEKYQYFLDSTITIGSGKPQVNISVGVTFKQK